MKSSKEAPEIKEDEVIENKPLIQENKEESPKTEEVRTPMEVKAPISDAPKQFALGQGPLQSQTEDVYDAKIIVDYDGAVDVTYLEKKDPAYAYRYLNINSDNLAIKTSNLLYSGGGWQIVPRDHALKVLGLRIEQLAPDGTYRIGKDLILSRMPKELFEKKMNHKTDKANKKMDGIDEKLAGEDTSLKGYGGKTMSGIQHKKNLPSTKW